ncbi:MAG: hypothetical protein LBG27_07750 [Spirochaetaceae bacterium]|jgi:hypothetical protein|nr:hypothetical protein [Spirochaetaceae bacterium]
MKKLVGSGIGIVLSAAAVYVFAPRGDALPLSATAEIPALVRDGDVICRLGDRSWSRWFKNVSPRDRRFSHAGIARIRNGRVTVIHAEGWRDSDFVREEALEDFLEIARAAGVYRLNTDDGDLMAILAAEYTGVPFDWRFDREDSTALYCTELIDVVLSRLPAPRRLEAVFFKGAGKEIIPLESISRSKLFTEVFYRSGG